MWYYQSSLELIYYYYQRFIKILMIGIKTIINSIAFIYPCDLFYLKVSVIIITVFSI